MNQKTDIYADGADLPSIIALNSDPAIAGITTNPTLMRKAGVADYASFAKAVLAQVTEKPVSLEVFADEPEEMVRQALLIASWGPNVFVKIPVTNSRGESTGPAIQQLSRRGVQLNITALMTVTQVSEILPKLASDTPTILSVFAGRIADTGRNPIPIMQAAKSLLDNHPQCKLLWASVREVLNIVQAQQAGCDIVTVPHDILHKWQRMHQQDLEELSLETVKMFLTDARAAGYTL
jgi:transaldolase